MPNLEPTYLRYVYDGLNKGSLNAENAAALPQGFIGLYEQEFTQKTPAGERKKVLNQLALWALFKGAVSANMAAAVLELEEEQMKDLVDTYSSWFNSPESGKYQLYHERLRVYLLQKLKAEEVQVLNEKLISFLEDAIKQANGEEDEYYALAHLHQHMALESQLGNHYKRLHSYVNQESLWRRQIQLSKGYAWSQNSVQQGIKEGARRNHEMNTIRSTVNSVKLMTQEQNSAEDILNLLNEGDFQAALKRAETWEGERQFKLYLLFIHELTIGTSSEADFRKEACKAVIEVIDQTPEDHSVLDWCKFYPELAIYKYHEELLKMELDGMVIWKRGNYTLIDLIKRNEIDIKSLTILVDKIKRDHDKFIGFLEMSKKLINTDLNNPLFWISKIEINWMKSKAFLECSKILIKKSKKVESKKFLNESIKVASKIIINRKKSEAYISISKFLLDINEIKQSNHYLKKSILITSQIIKDEDKNFLLGHISVELMKRGKSKDSIKTINEINSDLEKSEVYVDVIRVLMEQKKKSEALKLTSEISNDNWYLSEAFIVIGQNLINSNEKEESSYYFKKSINSISEDSIYKDFLKSKLLRDISKEYLKYGMENEVIKLIPEITFKNIKSKTYFLLHKFLFESKRYKESNEMLKKSLEIATENEFLMLSEYFLDLENIKDFKMVLLKSLLTSTLKNDNYSVIRYLSLVPHPDIGSMFLWEKEKKHVIKNLLNHSISINSDVDDIWRKTTNLIEISRAFLAIGEKEEALRIAEDPNLGLSTFASTLLLLYVELCEDLIKIGKYQDSLDLVTKIISKRTRNFEKQKLNLIKSEACYMIGRDLLKKGNKKESKKMIKKSLNIASKIKSLKNRAEGITYHLISFYFKIGKVLFNYGDTLESKKMIKNALNIALMYNESYTKCKIYLEISKDLLEMKDQKLSNKFLNDSVNIASEINNKDLRIEIYGKISKELMIRGQKKESFSIISKIEDVTENSKAYIEVISVLVSKGKVGEANLICSKINNKRFISEAHLTIVNELIKIGKKRESINIASNISLGLERSIAFKNISKSVKYPEFSFLLKQIMSQPNKSIFITGFSEYIKESNEIALDVYPYLYNLSEKVQNLSNILFYQAKMACFFEENRNEEKLDMLSEVLDIKDWRRISA